MTTITKEIEEFCKQVGITPAQFTGDEVIDGNLNIKGDVIIPPGFAPTVSGELNLPRVTAIPERFAPVVGGFLYLDSVITIGDGFAPLVGRTLFLSRVTTIGEGFAPVVGTLLNLPRATTIGEGFAPIVGKSLRMTRATTIGNGFTPIVGSLLDLRRTATIGEDFAPVVGGDLYLDNITTLPAGCSPIVGASLYLNGRKTTDVKKLDMTKPIKARDGKYIIADKILTEVVSKRGNVWRMRRIGRDKISFLVTDGSGNFAHGDTLADARESLIYKISNRDTSEYEGLSQESELTFAAAIEMYRTITGACAAGTQHFVESNMIEKKNYTIREIINMTAGQYGHEQLVKFFNA